jgi:broad specificity phosphatase PhoE
VTARGWAFEEVLLARHGETEWNVSGRRQGRLDSPLTARGLAQAHRVADGLTGRPVDAVFASPLGRATATAGVCAARFGAPVAEIADLAEIDHGRMSGLTNAEIIRRFPGAAARRATDKYRTRFPGGESYADADLRAAAALEYIAGTGARHPLIVSHEMVGRMLLRNLLGLAPGEALRRRQPNNVVLSVHPGTRDCVELAF